MANPKNKKTISLLVPDSYQFGGAEVKKEIDDLFTWLWTNGGKDIIKSYPKYAQIREVLTKW
jgi:hypothetical protein